MKKLLFALALFAAPLSAYAQTTDEIKAAAAGAVAGAVASKATANPPKIDCENMDVRALSSKQIINLKEICAGQPTPVDEAAITPESVREWGSLSKEFGSAIASTTKELGVQVNDFLTTPAGLLITVYLFWEKLGGIVVGIPLLVLFWVVYFIIINRMRRTPKMFEIKPTLFGLINRKYVTEYENGKVDDIAIVSTLGAVATIVISFITIAFVIF